MPDSHYRNRENLPEEVIQPVGQPLVDFIKLHYMSELMRAEVLQPCVARLLGRHGV